MPSQVIEQWIDAILADDNEEDIEAIILANEQNTEAQNDTAADNRALKNIAKS